MEELKRDLEEFKVDLKKHMEQDLDAFSTINTKLDQLLGQWKLVGAIVGILAGVVASVIF